MGFRSGSAGDRSDGTLVLRAGSDAAQTVEFATAGGVLALGLPADFDGFVAGFDAGDHIDLVDTHVTSYTYSGDVLTAQDGASIVASLHFDGSYTKADFSLANDGHGGTVVGFV
jgi:hypothetical protein